MDKNQLRLGLGITFAVAAAFGTCVVVGGQIAHDNSVKDRTLREAKVEVCVEIDEPAASAACVVSVDR